MQTHPQIPTIMTFAFLLFFPWTNTSAAIDVCGLIGNGATWSIADSPITVSCSLNIAELTVEAGVEVLITGDYEIVVSGVIRALGTRESPVLFKSAPENSPGWDGFFFSDTIAGSEFRWTQIEGSKSSGVHIVRSSPVFDHVTFVNNSASRGGAILVESMGSDLQISNSLFVNNFASESGGAIFAVGSSGAEEAALVVSESVFVRNIVGTGLRFNSTGGAVHIEGNSRIAQCTFIENEAQAYTIYARGGRFTRGGAIFSALGRSEIISSRFIGNALRMSAHGQTPDASRTYGGALHLASGELLLSNSLLAENELAAARNRDYRGSGLYVASGVAKILNSTMANNDTHAVYNEAGEVEILNSILFFNNDSTNQIAGSVLATYSDIQNGFEGEGNISENPIFNEQYGIVNPSPAIDAGNPSSEFYDFIPPGQGGVRNDMGYLGGAAVFDPVADAGPDQDVNERTPVTLDGSGSHDLDNGSVVHSWVQISGPHVNLSNITSVQPTFTAPEVDEPTPLIFELVVNDSAPSRVTININNVIESLLEFDPTAVTVNEADGTVMLMVIRSGAIDHAVSADYASSDGSAIAPDDYTAVSGTVAFAVGETTASIPIAVNSDGLYEPPPNETFTVTLSSPIDAELGVGVVATVEIVDSNTQPLLGFDPTELTVNEGAGTVTLTVIRSGAINAANVDYDSRDGSATDPDDYSGVSGRLSFAVGQDVANIVIPIIDDAVMESLNEDFTVTLSNPTGGALLSDANVRITIVDADPPPPPPKAAANSDGSGTSTVFQGGISSGNGFGEFFTVGDTILISVTIFPEAGEVSSNAEIFVVVWDGSNFLQLTPEGLIGFDGTVESLIAFTEVVLDETNNIDILESFGGAFTLTSAEVGNWSIFVGYSTGDGVITYIEEAIALEVIE